MPGYRGTYSDDFVRQLVDKIVLLEDRVRELEKPTATQKARVVLRLGQAEIDLRAVEVRMGDTEQYVLDLRAVDDILRGQIGELERRAGVNDQYILGIWAKDAAQDGAIAQAQATANSAESTAGSALWRAELAAGNTRLIGDYLTTLLNYLKSQNLNPPPPPLLRLY